MDVNTGDLSQREFMELANTCVLKDTWQCRKTGFACKDYLCFRVKIARDADEARELFAKQLK
jgi:hypothetical protein